MNQGNILFRIHALQRMFERNVPLKKVLMTIDSGETVEDYSAETPDSSRLILGFQGKRPLHVVCSENLQTQEITIITVYIPDPGKWSKDFKRRRS